MRHAIDPEFDKLVGETIKQFPLHRQISLTDTQRKHIYMIMAIGHHTNQLEKTTKYLTDLSKIEGNGNLGNLDHYLAICMTGSMDEYLNHRVQNSSFNDVLIENDNEQLSNFGKLAQLTNIGNEV